MNKETCFLWVGGGRGDFEQYIYKRVLINNNRSFLDLFCRGLVGGEGGEVKYFFFNFLHLVKYNSKIWACKIFHFYLKLKIKIPEITGNNSFVTLYHEICLYKINMYYCNIQKRKKKSLKLQRAASPEKICGLDHLFKPNSPQLSQKSPYRLRPKPSVLYTFITLSYNDFIIIYVTQRVS